VHPDFEFFTELPGFGQLLQKQVRLWSFGVQEGIEYDAAASNSLPTLRHSCIEIFPIGGFIYITDDVFEETPQLALMIMKSFFAKIDSLRILDGPVSTWQEADDASLLWRLCVRPELMAHLFQKCEQQEKELQAGDRNISALAELYTLLSDTNYIEQDSPVQSLNISPDTFPVMSERRIIADEKPVEYFTALSHSREEANLRMIRYYAGLQIDMRRKYRHFFVVHTDTAATCVKRWKEEIQSIAEVISPQQCINELVKNSPGHGKNQMFDFYGKFMPEVETGQVTKTHTKQATDVQNPQITTSQPSVEDVEILPTQ
jgi:chromo domain-containing protein 1